MWNRSQLALVREAGIAGNSLSAGLTALRKANYAHQGLYSHAFFSLSIGLERLLKIIYMMNHLIENQGAFPTDADLRGLGHDIEILFLHAVKIKEKYAFDTEPSSIPSASIEAKIVRFMSRFAKSTRYFNLDLLAGSIKAKNSTDPIAEWFLEIGQPILKKHFKPHQEAKVRRNAELIDKLVGQYMLVTQTAEDGSPLESALSASYHTGMTDVIRKYGTFYCARLSKYLYHILWELRHKCHKEGIEVPYLDELFFPFMNDDAYLLGRKTFPPQGQGF